MAQTTNLPLSVNELSFGFINLNPARASSILLNQISVSLSLDIMRLNEPYYNIHRLAYLSTSCGQVAVTDKPRVVIIIANRNLNYSIIVKERDIIIISIDYKKHRLLIINMYSSPSDDFNDTVLKLEHYSHRYTNTRIIITGDFNAKHNVWGSPKNDNRGCDGTYKNSTVTD